MDHQHKTTPLTVGRISSARGAALTMADLTKLARPDGWEAQRDGLAYVRGYRAGYDSALMAIAADEAAKSFIKQQPPKNENR